MSSKFFASAGYLNNGYNVHTAMYIAGTQKKNQVAKATWMTKGNTRNLLALVYLSET
ncbi:hypothetical protein wCauATS_05650 [Wolbachia pipientis]|nr:hypothetical protein N499_0387 [Wolbachia pipientis wVitA]GKS79762.1 hypothetical protein wHmb_06480 [Wolbachia pipientis]